MTVKIEIFSDTADEAREELRKLLADTPIALTSAVVTPRVTVSSEAVDLDGVAPAGETAEQKAKHHRRTKAEMEAARLAEQAAEEPAEVEPVVIAEEKPVVAEPAKDAPINKTGKLDDPVADLFTAVSFEDAFAAFQKEYPEAEETGFLRQELHTLTDKIGLEAARAFMAATGFGSIGKIKPEDRGSFLTAVRQKLREVA